MTSDVERGMTADNAVCAVTAYAPAPGDVLFFELDTSTTLEQAERIKAELSAALPDQAIVVLAGVRPARVERLEPEDA